MGRGRIFIYLGLIIILGLVAVFVIATRFPGFIGGGSQTTVQATPVPEVPKVTVIASTQRIPRGGQITDDVIDEFVFPEDLLVEGMYTNREDVVGLLARYDLEPGTYLSRGNLVEDIDQVSSAGSLAALLIPKGMVAVSIPVNRLTSVSYGLERGDQVNVIVTMPFVDLDADYQSLLPNSTSAVISPGPNALLGEGASSLTAQTISGEAGRRLAGWSWIRSWTSRFISFLPNPSVRAWSPRLSFKGRLCYNWAHSPSLARKSLPK